MKPVSFSSGGITEMLWRRPGKVSRFAALTLAQHVCLEFRELDLSYARIEHGLLRACSAFVDLEVIKSVPDVFRKILVMPAVNTLPEWSEEVGSSSTSADKPRGLTSHRCHMALASIKAHPPTAGPQSALLDQGLEL